MDKAKCEEIIIDQYLKGNIGNDYKNAALLELHKDICNFIIPNQERKGLVWILEWASGFGPDNLILQLRHLEKIYLMEEIERIKKENEALIKELKELEHELSE